MLPWRIRGNRLSNKYLKEHELIFNGKNSTYYSLVISEYPSIQQLNEEVEEIEVDGRNSSLTVRKGVYKDRPIKFTFRLLNTDYLWTLVDDIEEWFLNITDNRLIYERQDRCFRVKRVILGDIGKEIDLYGEFDVTFICEPFRTDLDYTIEYFNNMAFEDENTKTFFVNGIFNSEPKITVYGHGDITLIVNDASILLNNVDEQVTIDSRLMQVIDKDGNKFKTMDGDYPLLTKDINTISINGNVIDVKIEYINNYR